MIARFIFCAVLATVGWHGLFPDPPEPPTAASLQAKAKVKSVSAVCQRHKEQKQSAVRKMCRRWGRYDD